MAEATGGKSGSPQQHRMGEHWSGANPVPTVQKYVERLDNEKKDRDLRIDEENRQKLEREKNNQWHDTHGEKHDEGQEDAVAHKAREVSKAKMRTVTDPTTGKDIGVEDQDETSMEAVKNPMVCTVFHAVMQEY